MKGKGSSIIIKTGKLFFSSLSKVFFVQAFGSISLKKLGIY
jgi:hypothetical protein